MISVQLFLLANVVLTLANVAIGRSGGSFGMFDAISSLSLIYLVSYLYGVNQSK